VAARVDVSFFDLDGAQESRDRTSKKTKKVLLQLSVTSAVVLGPSSSLSARFVKVAAAGDIRAAVAESTTAESSSAAAALRQLAK